MSECVQDQRYRKPTKVSAPQYVDLLMAWIEDQLNDERIFPTQVEHPFPKNFKAKCSKIMQRLFRVYAHIYHVHFDKIVELNAPAHLNSAFRRFILFTNEFELLRKQVAPAPACHANRLVCGSLPTTFLHPPTLAGVCDCRTFCRWRTSSSESQRSAPRACMGTQSVQRGVFDNDANTTPAGIC